MSDPLSTDSAVDKNGWHPIGCLAKDYTNHEKEGHEDNTAYDSWLSQMSVRPRSLTYSISQNIADADRKVEVDGEKMRLRVSSVADANRKQLRYGIQKASEETKITELAKADKMIRKLDGCVDGTYFRDSWKSESSMAKSVMDTGSMVDDASNVTNVIWYQNEFINEASEGLKVNASEIFRFLKMYQVVNIPHEYATIAGVSNIKRCEEEVETFLELIDDRYNKAREYCINGLRTVVSRFLTFDKDGLYYRQYDETIKYCKEHLPELYSVIEEQDAKVRRKYENNG